MKRFYIFFSAVLLSTSFMSCSKWLDLQPQDGITKSEFWKTKEDVRSALFGIYSSMNGGGVEQQIFLWGELRGDMIDATALAAEDYRFVRNSNILSTNVIANWSAMYHVINNCNLLIDFAGDAKAADPTFTDALYNSYVGEALTIRSMMYFYLLRTFRDIPLKLKGSYQDKDIVNTEKSTGEQVIQQLKTDLLRAKEMVPNYHVTPVANQSESLSNKGRITKPAVLTLLADVYLWNEEYEKAEAELDLIIASGRYHVLGRASLNIFEGGTVETIFEISHRESAPSVMFQLVVDSRRLFIANTAVLGSEIFMPNTEIDVDLHDSRGEGSMYTSGGSIPKHGTENPNHFNFQIYRISDVLLMKAEAANEQGRGGEALTIIQNLREARGAIAATAREIFEEDTEGINTYILEERARELSFEGKRWFDLLRFAKKKNYASLNSLIDLVTKTVDISVRQSAINKIRNIDSHYLPIAEDELFKDPLLVQNPFYN